MLETVIIRHPKENLAKCSVTPLEAHPGYRFLVAEPELCFDATGYTLLKVGVQPLSAADAVRPLLCLDATWQLLPKVEEKVVGKPILRSIPAGIRTAYPRVSRDGGDPFGGLASIEALFMAHVYLGWSIHRMLDGYYWRRQFLEGLPVDVLGQARRLGLDF